MISETALLEKLPRGLFIGGEWVDGSRGTFPVQDPATATAPAPRQTVGDGAPVLRVEAVGFAPWQGHWLGILITPWFMNLVLVPGEAASWQGVAPGKRRFCKFPSGDFAFLGSVEPEIGEPAVDFL